MPASPGRAAGTVKAGVLTVTARKIRVQRIEPLTKVHKVGPMQWRFSYCDRVVGGLHLWMYDAPDAWSEKAALRRQRRYLEAHEQDQQQQIVKELMEEKTVPEVPAAKPAASRLSLNTLDALRGLGHSEDDGMTEEGWKRSIMALSAARRADKQSVTNWIWELSESDTDALMKAVDILSAAVMAKSASYAMARGEMLVWGELNDGPQAEEKA